MIEGKYLSYGDDLDEVFKIRKEVFQVEQQVSEEIERDALDQEAIHVLVYSGKKAVATGRILYDGNEYKIGRIAVLKEERGKEYGDFVVRLLVDKAFVSGAKEVLLGAQKQVIGFYEKIGFEVYGEPYMDAGIEHMHMRLRKQNLCRGCGGK